MCRSGLRLCRQQRLSSSGTGPALLVTRTTPRGPPGTASHELIGARARTDASAGSRTASTDRPGDDAHHVAKRAARRGLERPWDRGDGTVCSNGSACDTAPTSRRPLWRGLDAAGRHELDSAKPLLKARARPSWSPWTGELGHASSTTGRRGACPWTSCTAPASTANAAVAKPASSNTAARSRTATSLSVAAFKCDCRRVERRSRSPLSHRPRLHSSRSTTCCTRVTPPSRTWCSATGEGSCSGRGRWRRTWCSDLPDAAVESVGESRFSLLLLRRRTARADTAVRSQGWSRAIRRPVDFASPSSGSSSSSMARSSTRLFSSRGISRDVVIREKRREERIVELTDGPASV